MTDINSKQLSEIDAQNLINTLYKKHIKKIADERDDEMTDRSITLNGKTMPFTYKDFGSPPSGKKSLFISMHGGGSTSAEVNDKQWNNQKNLYKPEEGIYLAPRAPTNTWNLWHQEHIDKFFDRLIENFIAFHDVDPNKIYIMGYSAGGDGVYQLAPRMADRLAAAAMMAGHPNETKPYGLRNLPFTIHMGGKDSGYGRNQEARNWKEWLAELQKSDPKGYKHSVVIHENKGHWMNLQDASAVGWMAKFERIARPERIVWLQDDVTHNRFYWLSTDAAIPRERIVAERSGNTINILEGGENGLRIRLDDRMVDLDKPVVVKRGDAILHQGIIPREKRVIETTLEERGDPEGIYTAEIKLTAKALSPLKITLANDNGFSNSDRKTSDPTLHIEGLENGSILEYKYANNIWLKQEPEPKHGNNTIVARQRGSFNNTSAITSFEFELIQPPPAKPITALPKPHTSGSMRNWDYEIAGYMEDTGLGFKVELNLDNGDSYTDKISDCNQLKVKKTVDYRNDFIIQYQAPNSNNWSTFNPQFNWKHGTEHLPPLTDFNYQCDPFGGSEGKNTIKLRIKDGQGNSSQPYEFQYIFNENTQDVPPNDQLLDTNSMSNLSTTNSIFNTASNNSSQNNQRYLKHHPLRPRSNYTHASADQIKSFRQSGKKKLLISGEWMDQGKKSNLLEVINHDRALNAAARSEAPLIYNRCDGRLYLNGNGALPSFGDSSEGGLLAILQNSPTLTPMDFIVG